MGDEEVVDVPKDDDPYPHPNAQGLTTWGEARAAGATGEASVEEEPTDGTAEYDGGNADAAG